MLYVIVNCQLSTAILPDKLISVLAGNPYPGKFSNRLNLNKSELTQRYYLVDGVLAYP